MTLLPQEGGEGQCLLSFLSSGTLTNCFIKYPPSEGTAFPSLFFFLARDTSVESKQVISHCIMNIFSIRSSYKCAEVLGLQFT